MNRQNMEIIPGHPSIYNDSDFQMCREKINTVKAWTWFNLIEGRLGLSLVLVFPNIKNVYLLYVYFIEKFHYLI
jgi:hypothetical protein